MSPSIPIAMNRFRPSPVETLGYGLLFLYLFLYVSRVIVEFLLSGARIPLILTVAFLLCAIIGGRLAQILQSRLGWLIGIFTAWVGVCVPFSVWKGGSTEVFLEALRSLLVLFSIVGLTSTTGRWLKLTGAIGFAIALAAVFSLFKGDFRVADRLALEGGMLGDPNFYCWYLIIGLPILWGISRNAVTGIGKIGGSVLGGGGGDRIPGRFFRGSGDDGRLLLPLFGGAEGVAGGCHSAVCAGGVHGVFRLHHRQIHDLVRSVGPGHVERG